MFFHNKKFRMPELPEVEIIKRSLFRMINKEKIIDVKTSNKKLRYKLHSSFKKDLIGEKILNISRRSKYIIFYFKNKFLLIHLGMTGKFFIKRTKDNKLTKTSFYYNLNFIKKHNHVHFLLNNGLMLIYNDVRRFGFMKLYKNSNLKKSQFIKKLGVEPLSNNLNNNYFRQFTFTKQRNIKNMLMDQTFISGLGNIYVNEILFMTKIHPLTKCLNLKNSDISKLIFTIKKILNFSILKGGSSIKDFENISGKKGSFQQFFTVYNKENSNCSRISCTGKIKKIKISNRSSFYCEKCQN